MLVVSVLYRFKNKEQHAASGQESVVLAAEVEIKLGNCLHRGVNLPFLCQTSCSCGSLLHRNNKLLQ